MVREAISDQASPWLLELQAHLGVNGEPLGFEPGQCAAGLEALRKGSTACARGFEGLRFEASTEALKALEYEARVAQGVIPTRDVFHDWYNGLVCLGFPRSKRAINRLHLECARNPAGATGSLRGRQRDALTLLDESGALILSTQADLDALLTAHDWTELLVRRRADWGASIRMVCMGHGLLDALRKPHKALCAKVLVEVVEDTALPITEVDALLERRILTLGSPRELRPLPVMGVPGWFECNQDQGFYQDERVFRKKPTR